MIDIIFSFFLVVTYFIIYLFSSGEKRNTSKKENLKEVITGADGKLLLVTVMGILIMVIWLYFYGLGL
jgi:NhaP-type Na+/H+ or K+/H+ antiporter